MSAADYSSARPGGAALAAAGITAVGRYLAPPGDSRALEAAEYADLRAHGIDVWLNREGTAEDMLNGYAKGVYHGQTAADNLRRLGLTPGQVVVYASADFDAQPGHFAAMDAYLDGFGSVLGPPSVIGIYGSMPYINHCRQTGKATWFWQSASTSFSHGQTGFVHIQQTTAPSMAGTDNDILYAANYGQIGNSTTAEDPQMLALKIHNGSATYCVTLDVGVFRHLLATDNAEWVKNIVRSADDWQDVDISQLPVLLWTYGCDLKIWDIRNGDFAVLNPLDGSVKAGGMWSAENALRAAVANIPTTDTPLTDAQLQALEQGVATAVSAAVTSAGMSIPQAQVDAIASEAATQVRTTFTTNPLK